MSNKEFGLFDSDEQLTVPLTRTQTPPTSPPAAADPDRLESWLSSPIPSFSNWLDTRHILNPQIEPLKESSKTVKKAMWAKFCRWMTAEAHDLSFCSSQFISTFIDDAGLFREQRQRYVRLIESVYDHLYSLGLCIDNPGQKAGVGHVGAGFNETMRWLTVSERERLFSGLRQIWNEEELKDKSWTVVRDAAMIGVITGGGAKLSEVAELTVNCTSHEGYLIIPSVSGKEHRAPLLPIGIEALEVWGRVRARLGFGGRVLFPADIRRRRDDQNGPFQTMHHATIYRRIQAMFKRFSIDASRLESPRPGKKGPATKRNGAQTLRNTYAAMLFERGESDAIVSEALGLFGELSAPRLRMAHNVWIAQQQRVKAANEYMTPTLT